MHLDQCPFCGSNSVLKHPFSDRINNASLTFGELTVKGDLNKSKTSNYFYKCNICEREYHLASVSSGLTVRQTG